MNKNLYITLISLFSFLSCGYSQTIMFERNYSDSNAVEAKAVRQTFDGGYILAGRRNFPAVWFSNDALLMKTDSLGNIEWLKVYGTTFDDDWFEDVKQTPDSGFIACGEFPVSSMGFNMYAVKTDKNGDTIWTRNFGSTEGDLAWSIEPTFDGGYILAGQWDTTGVLLKLDANGDTIWKKHFHDYNGIALYSVAQLIDSGYVATGILSTGLPSPNNEIYVVRTDKNGDTIWTRIYGYNDSDFGQSIKFLNEGKILVGAYSWQGSNNYDTYLLELDLNGDTIWDKLLPDPMENALRSLDVTLTGDIVLSEIKMTTSSGYQASVIKTDSLGNILWQKEYGGMADEYIFGISSCKDGGIAVCGMTESFGALPEIYFVKTDTNGSIVGVNDPVLPGAEIIKVWPNPFSNEIFIDISSLPSGEYSFTLFDAKGSLIKSMPVNRNDAFAKISIDFTLETGFYFLKISNGNDFSHTVKLIKY